MNNRARICLLFGNLAYPFVSSIGVKLTLPNFFFLPVCLVECTLDLKMISLLLLITWFCLWYIFFKNKARLLPVIILQTVLMIHVLKLGFEALHVKGAVVLLSAKVLPSYILLLSYLFISHEYYRFRSDKLFKTQDRA